MTSQLARLPVPEPVHCVVSQLPTTQLSGGTSQAAELTILQVVRPPHGAHLTLRVLSGRSSSLGGSSSPSGGAATTVPLTVANLPTLGARVLPHLALLLPHKEVPRVVGTAAAVTGFLVNPTTLGTPLLGTCGLLPTTFGLLGSLRSPHCSD